MWKVVESIRFQMDAREVYQGMVRLGDTGPLLNLSANGVRFACRPRPGGTQAGQYCVLLQASLVMEPSPAVRYGVIRAPQAGTGEGVQAVHVELVIARLLIRQVGPRCSEGVLGIVPYLELPEGDAHCLANLAAQHMSGSAFHQLAELVTRDRSTAGD